MNTLEYLQLKSIDFDYLHPKINLFGVFIYGNESKGIFFYKGLNLIRKFYIENYALNGDAKSWSEKGELLDHELYEDNVVIKNYLI